MPKIGKIHWSDASDGFHLSEAISDSPPMDSKNDDSMTCHAAANRLGSGMTMTVAYLAYAIYQNLEKTRHFFQKLKK